MADEDNGVVVPEAPTPEAVPSEAPATDTAPVEGEAPKPEGEPVPAKTFTQEELDAIIGKRLAIEQRKFARMVAAANPPKPVEVKPFAEYESPEAFAKDVAAQALETAETTKTEEAEIATFVKAVEKAVEKYPDFEQVAFTHPFMTADMAKAIRVSPVATELAYHLGKNLEEAERISSLSPVAQIRELVRIEAKLEAAPPKAAVSKAPAPIKPVGGNNTATPNTDPSKMSMDEYREYRKKAGAQWAR